MLKGRAFFIHPIGFGKRRKEILAAQIAKQGGSVVGEESEAAEYDVIAEDSLEPSSLAFPKRRVLKVSWLTQSFKADQLEPQDAFIFPLPPSPPMEKSLQEPDTASTSSPRNSRKRHADDTGGSESEASDTEVEAWFGNVAPNGEAFEVRKMSPEKRAKFVCAQNSQLVETTKAAKPKHNVLIIEKLQILADGYNSSRDRWRALSYEKAVKAIQNFPERIETQEQIAGIKGVGDRIAKKVWEIVTSGDLRKAAAFEASERIQALRLFNEIWGVGPVLAEQWYAQGLRTLADVGSKARLSRQQAIGLRLHSELLERMPRAEAAEIAGVVEAAALGLGVPDLLVQPCGSFRRGRPDCGDVDVLLSHPQRAQLDNLLPNLVRKLTEDGFLTDHLVECASDGNQKKYMGVCRLAGDGRKHRRLDVIVVPWEQLGTSLLYFTGSAHFTRSVYALAKRLGLRLNQHGLRGGIMRAGGEKLNEGYPIPTPTEESVFQRLGIPYRTPEERDHP